MSRPLDRDGLDALLLRTADTGNALHDEHGDDEGFDVMARRMGVEPEAFVRKAGDMAGDAIKAWLEALPADASFSQMTAELRSHVMTEAIVWFRAGVEHGERRAEEAAARRAA